MDRFNLLNFDKTTLAEMNSVSLMKRVDTKFILKESQLLEVLSKLYDDYKILQIDQERLMTVSYTHLTLPTKRIV